MGSLILTALLALFLLSPIPTALAAEAEAPHDGYLFRLSGENAVLYSALPEGIAPVLPDAGVYRAESLEDIQESFPEEAVAYIEPDYLVTLFDEPDDPLYCEQWGLSVMGAEAAWSAGLDGSGVRIGIVDSGLWAEHEDLVGAHIIPGRNYIDGSDNTGDEVGHGTFVTGLIAAQRGNGVGIAGLAPEAEIVPLKCFDSRNGAMSDIVQAIRSGVDDYHCDILNMSFGLASNSQTLKEAIDYAADRSVILTAAVGNNGTTTLNYPAAYDSVIGVGMVGPDSAVAAHSQRNQSVFVTAPGYQVLGLGTSAGALYRSGNGTSYACPYVSAAAALLVQKCPELSPRGVMEFFRATAQDMGLAGYDTSYGYGIAVLPGSMERFQPSVAREGGSVCVRGAFFSRTEAPRLLAAYVDGAGRMLEVTALSCWTDGALRTVDNAQEVPANAVQICIYALDRETLCPLQPAVRMTL